jgi:dTDP-4-amino-4,6-dideoxygalactose transaminase
VTTVPFLDLTAVHAALELELHAALARVLRGPTLILGPELDAFESELAEQVGAAHAVGVGNGFDALHLALRALGVGPGDDVLVPSNTYVATWLSVSATGARPVGIEPDPRTHNLDPDLLDRACTPQTRAVVPVHLYGRPADMVAIEAWAAARGVDVVADGAQAHGARLHGRPVGAHGRATAWSFYPTKNLGALGDGGAVTTDDPELASRIRALRSYGALEPGRNELLGVNSRLDELQAALLRVKLPHLDAWNDARRARAERYLAELAGVDLILPVVTEGIEPVWHQFVVRTGDRDALRRRLAEQGIATMAHYPVPPFAQPVYAGTHPRDAFPVARQLAAEVVSLPISPTLTDEQQSAVIAALRGGS